MHALNKMIFVKLVFFGKPLYNLLKKEPPCLVLILLNTLQDLGEALWNNFKRLWKVFVMPNVMPSSILCDLQWHLPARESPTEKVTWLYPFNVSPHPKAEPSFSPNLSAFQVCDASCAYTSRRRESIKLTNESIALSRICGHVYRRTEGVQTVGIPTCTPIPSRQKASICTRSEHISLRFFFSCSTLLRLLHQASWSGKAWVLSPTLNPQSWSS